VRMVVVMVMVMMVLVVVLMMVLVMLMVILMMVLMMIMDVVMMVLMMLMVVVMKSKENIVKNKHEKTSSMQSIREATHQAVPKRIVPSAT
jgi:hypothetical protein